MKDRFKVLVADGNRNVREFLRRELVLSGYEAVTSGNPAELLSTARKNGHLDLLVLDPEMPLLDGAALCGLLEGRLPPLPLILYGFGEDCANPVLLACAAAFVERGGDLESLKEAVRRVLAAHHPQRFSRWRSAAGPPRGSWIGSERPKPRSP